MSGLAQPLLGRDAEFRRLESALARAGEGSPSIVVCSGEAGIGKTWLASAFRAQAAAAGALVGSGAALQLAGAPPFLPWSTALRQVAPAAAEALDADRVDQPSARIRVGRFDAVVAGVRQAARGPLALVLDDMHWADDASLLLLRHVARTVSTECLLVLVLTRGGDSRDELWSTVLRAPSVTMLPLPPLAGTSVREQVAALTGRVPSDRELAQLMRLTGGNPFFVAEVAAAWQREGWDARRFVSGPAVAGAITERLAALTAGDREVVDAAAVVGPLADAPLVARVARRGLAAATVALGAGVTAGLLRRVGGERYTFVHELVREAVLAGMPVTALVTLHRRAAEILETGRLDPGDATVFAVAAHWLAVAAEVEPDREPAVAVRAADAASIAAAEAMRRWAYEDALDLLDRALRLSAIRCHTSGAGGSEGAEAARLRRCRLLLQRAAAADVVGALALEWATAPRLLIWPPRPAVPTWSLKPAWRCDRSAARMSTRRFARSPSARCRPHRRPRRVPASSPGSSSRSPSPSTRPTRRR